MAISGDLFRAILAMDSYNRGDSAGLDLSGTKLGDAVIGKTSSDLPMLFSAVAYDYNGQIIISYRGTDYLLPDFISGWVIGGGALSTPFNQADLAISFYKTVLEEKGLTDPYTANVLFTGHSLGGGLAGLTAALFGQPATIFDNMPFEKATANYYTYWSAPAFTPAPSFIGISAYATAGEILTLFRGLQFTPVDTLSSHADFPSVLGPLNLHSQSLLVLLLYSNGQGFNDWHSIGNQFMSSLFDNDVALAAGADSITGTSRSNGQFSEILRSAIAYSAIDTGTRPFGDTGIRALFNDANDLGKVLGLVDVSSTLKDSADKISDMFTQFAGQLALGKVLRSDTVAQDNHVLDGVLTLSTATPTTPDRNILTINFADALWKVGRATAQASDEVLGKTELIHSFLAAGTHDLETGMQWLWKDPVGKTIDKLEFATREVALNEAIDNRTADFTNVGMFVGSGVNDTISGSRDRDLIYGGKGNDIIRGGAGNDVVAGGGGDDRLSGGGADWDYIAGGDGVDTVFYDNPAAGLTVNVKKAPPPSLFANPLLLDKVTELNTNGDIDRIVGIETVELSDLFNDKVVIHREGGSLPTNILFDGKGGSNDVLSYTTTFPSMDANIREVLSNTSSVAAFHQKIDLIKNIERIDLTSGSDTVDIKLLPNTAVKEIHGGGSKDIVSVQGSAAGSIPKIYLEAGDDVLKHAPRGSIVYGGADKDTFELAKDTLIADADTTDRVTFYEKYLSGGVQWKGQESPWAKGLMGLRYAQGSDGELVIDAKGLDQAFIANFNFNPNTAHTAGITVGEMSLTAYRLFDAPKGAQIYESFEAVFGNYFKAMFGSSNFAGVDPLMLDLDGDGLELNARLGVSPHFDIDADGFAEQSGWLRGDDAFLVRDNNANGKIDNVSEMFGNAATTGFAALAASDTNKDGKIDSADTGFASLKLWRDLNSNAATDAGELQTLTQAGIVSLSLAKTTANQDVAGNIITAISGFTRTDGKKFTIGDVTVRSNQRDTIWLGDKTIDAASAALPELKGFGTLTDLHIAMTDRASLKTAVQNALPSLSSLNLSSMRAAVLPVMNEWRAAVPVPAGTAGTVGRSDVPILTKTDINGTELNDYAYKVTDASGSYWKLASGAAVTNSSGAVIPRPTFTDVMAQASTNGAWTVLSGQQIQFVERYWGMEIPVGVVAPADGSAIAAASSVINAMWDVINGVAVRLAVQGPLASYFAGIDYNPVTDRFEATTDKMIVPTLEKIFAAAPTTASGATTHLAAWKPVLDVFLDSFDRGNNLVISYAFLFQNVVAAYENVGLAATIKQAADALGVPMDMIVTGSGTLNGTSGADLFYLNSGNHIAKGGLGPDSYIVGKNFGKDTIDDVEDPLSGSPDTLRFAQLNPNQLTMTRDGLDLIIKAIGATDELRIVGQFSRQLSGFGLSGLDPDHGVQEIIFANGAVWDKIDIAKAVSTHTDGNDIISGTDTIDFLDGGKGADTLRGGAEGDLYFFGRGDGQDIVYDSMDYVGIDSPDVVRFKAGVAVDQVTFTRQGPSNDLVIKINNTSDQLTIQEQFAASYTGVLGTQWFYRIEGFAFADGTAVAWDDVFEKVIQSNQTGGNDTIYGFAYTDVLDGGVGNDFLSGGNEGDLYIMGLGYGHDTISDNRDNVFSGNNDTLQFREGVRPSEVQLFRPIGTNDLVMTLIDGSKVTIKDQFFILHVFSMDTGRMEYFTFADGTEWTADLMKQKLINLNSTAGNDTLYGYVESNDVLNGGAGDDYIDGLSGTDTITGGKGNDILANDGQLVEVGDTTYLYTQGDGVDTIREGAFAGNDAIKFTGAALSSTNMMLTRSADLMSATLGFAGVTDKIFLDNQFGPYGAGVEQFTFSNGLTWTKDDLQKKYLATVSTTGNDTIYGFGSNINHAVNDVITGGKGNDSMDGLMGEDIYIHNQGDGIDTIVEQGFSGNDTLKLTGTALTSANVTVSRSASDLETATLGFNGMTDKVILKGEFSPYGAGVESIIFSDGVTWGISNLQTRYLANNSTPGNDTIYGFGNVKQDTSDTIVGGKGDDYMNGLVGDDIYIHNQGDGIDTIDEGYAAGSDTLKLTGSALTSTNFTISNTGANGYTAALTFGGVTDKILIPEQLSWSPAYGIEKITFSDAIVLNRSELFTGFDTVDTLTGNANNNFLFGFSGNDTLSGGAGNDTLAGGAGADKLDGGTGIDTVSYLSSAAGVNVNLGLTTAQAGGDAAGDILTGIENVVGSNFNDTLTGLLNAAGTLNGGSGNDRLIGGNPQNTLLGGAGNDVMTGGSGADFFKYLAAIESGTAAGVRDVITDFLAGTDKIDLSNFAGTFAFKGTGAFSGTAKEVNYAQSGGNTIVGVDADGNGVLDFQIELTGLRTLTASDFLL